MGKVLKARPASLPATKAPLKAVAKTSPAESVARARSDPAAPHRRTTTTTHQASPPYTARRGESH